MVTGDPVPQGSTKAFAVKGRAFTTSTNAGPLARYRNDIRNAYVTHPARAGTVEPDPDMLPTFHGGVVLTVEFLFKRPASHYNSRGLLKDDTYAKPAPFWVEKKPDLDKLIRAVGDALTGFAYADDAEVVAVHAHKKWAQSSSTYIIIENVDA